MALYLLHASQKRHRNPAGMHSVLVDAVDEAAAGAAATRVNVSGWDAVKVADAASLPDGRTVLWFEGPCASLLGRTRGGSAL